MNFSDRVWLVRKYAQAFFKAYEHTKLVSLSESFFKIAYALKHAPLTLVILAHVSDPHTFKQCVELLSKKYDLEPALVSVLQLLHEHKRVMLFADVCAYIGKLIDHFNNIERAQLLCTPLLQPEQEAVIAQYLARKLGKEKVVFSVKIDNSLIAGVRIIGANWIWERSISKKLRILNALCAQYAA